MGAMSIWHWLIVLVIIMLVFGTKKLRNIGSDLGGAVRGFKEGVKDGEKSASAESQQKADSGRTIDVETREKRFPAWPLRLPFRNRLPLPDFRSPAQ